MAAFERSRILVVDDSPVTLEVLERNLTASGYEVRTAPGATEAIEAMSGPPFDLVITDYKMPIVSGLDLVRHVRENYRQTGVIIITGFASIETAVEAVKSGAEDYLSKPFTDEELLAAVRSALERVRVRRSVEPETSPASSATGLIADSAAMRPVLAAIPKAAASIATVLITGESGTGKELVARAIHYAGPRAASPFVPVNCGAIPSNLVESELFGHMKGAFTGATTSRAGFFLTADGGTVFLDEISELPAAVQTHLLRVLQDGEVQMVGASRPQRVDVRVIAATNKSLPGLVQKGAFREDLYFRLHVLTIELPPLRERGDDVLRLLAHFTRKYAGQAGRGELHYSDRALAALRSYHWPGNVRELENLVQRLVAMSDHDEIDAADLPAAMRFAVEPSSGPLRTLEAVEREHIESVLRHTGNNKTRAAEILGIDRKTLREKLKNHEI